MQRVAVFLVNWKRAEDTVACVRSLLKLDFSGTLDVFVCENGSPDESFSMMTNAFASFSKVEDLPNLIKYIDLESGRRIALAKAPHNLGFAGGNNFVIKIALACYDGKGYDYYWILNNDTEVDVNCLSIMVRKFNQEKRNVGICGSTLVYHHDKHTVQVLGGSLYSAGMGTMREIGNGRHWPFEVDESEVESEMSYVCGASMLVSDDVIRTVGLMKEDYFLFFEEIDWCERARKAGFELAYASKAVVYHKEGASIGTGTGARRSLLAEYYGMRNKLLVTWRFFPWAIPSVWLISWMQVARRLFQRRPENAWLMAKVLLGLGKRPV